MCERGCKGWYAKGWVLIDASIRRTPALYVDGDGGFEHARAGNVYCGAGDAQALVKSVVLLLLNSLRLSPTITLGESLKVYSSR